MRLDGIHHVTCITGDAPANVDYYAGTLELRLVKKSVNQDDPTLTYLRAAALPVIRTFHLTKRAVVVLSVGAVFLAALALSPAGAAAPLPCTVGTWSCLGWDGITSQVVPGMLNTETGSAITFATNHTETRVGDLQWAIGNERCTLAGSIHVPINMGVGSPPERGHQVQAGTASVPIDMGWGVRTKLGWQAPVVAGHFSKTWTLTNSSFAKRHLPTTVVWHLTGTISGRKAHGTMRWAFTGLTKNACSPSSGSFTWHASIGGGD